MGVNLIMVSSYIAHIQCSVRFTHITPGHSTCSFMYHFDSLFGAYNTCSHFGARNAHIAISVLPATHLHLSQVKHVRIKCLAQGHNIDNVPILRGEKHDISLKILHQAGCETARQAVTLTKLRALAIAPRPSLFVIIY